MMDGEVSNSGSLAQAKSGAEAFICSCLQKGNNNVKMSPGGMLWFQSASNLQYTNSAGFVLAVYSNYLLKSGGTVSCPGGTLSPSDLLNFARSQVKNLHKKFI